ncbi:MAG: glycine--tRNA ligase subunit alpha [Bacteroidota bacterium]
MSFYEMYTKLQDFWVKKGATAVLPYNLCVGAATFHPKCFFSVLKSTKEAYVHIQKSTRKADGRYGKSPNRLLNHHQLQVIFNPAPKNIKELFLESLESLGIDLNENFIQFNDNNWENISIGAIGIGWDVLCNNTEICQYTYFQKMADIELSSNAVELAYGIERLMFVLNKKSVFDCDFSSSTSYYHEFFEIEKQFSEYYFNFNKDSKDDFFLLKSEIIELISSNLYLPAYDLLIKMIDIFNSLDAKKEISLIQRKEYINTTRMIANQIANNYLQKKSIV